ncbi:hypothetical protein RZR10_23280 [Enterobacter asburiae]|uniref:hypothetical protein n=1 Tax=Enterobacteriaceae TaxID=543 RepID=UPI0015E92B87|nr:MULTISPECIES: hypothetical protein [Enterobacteriaceae]MCU3302379.1 hypothetical protein [Enterobacter hormaechei subsp. hoffmannii]MBA7874667.1 hypothetical protein [Citrobacter sp. RHBSTW-00827]MBA7935703.1 hypothetical protein [Citrobacter sp. RHBSTW-00509]MDV1796628.1 hypothetical protein [Enterobacter asburiae]QLS96526.1 hypothetical protein HV302_22530 [Citrobacter sp. RHBSTW-00859]
MFKKITANDLINKMEQDPDIISLKKIKPQGFLNVIYALKIPGIFAAAEKGHSVLDVLTKDGALNIVAFMLNSLSHRNEGKVGYFYRNFPCNYISIYNSSFEPMIASNEKYIFDLEVIVKTLISELNGQEFLIKLNETVLAQGNVFSFFPEKENNASEHIFDLNYIKMINERFLEGLSVFDEKLDTGKTGHITDVLSHLLGLTTGCQQNRGETEMCKFTKQKSKVHFFERKVAFDTMFTFVLLRKVLEVIKRANMLQSGVTKITMPGSPLQVLINENFTQDSFFIIKEQRRLLMKVVWYCSLLRLQDKKESILDENDRYLSPDVINHIYRNVSWLDSNSTRTAQYFWSLTKDAMDGKARSHIRRISFKRCYQQPVPLIDLSTRAGIKKFMGEHFDPDNVLWRTSKPKKAE